MYVRLFMLAVATMYFLQQPSVANGDLIWLNNHARKIQGGIQDGTGQVVDLIPSIDNGHTFTVDPTGKKIYWAEKTLGEIWRADIYGANASPLITGLVNPFGVAVDPSAGKIFWTDRDTQQVVSANLSDGLDRNIIATGQIELTSVVVDPVSQNVWWGHRRGVQKVTMASYDGSNSSTILDGEAPMTMRIDRLNGKLYWADDFSNDIYRADLNGANIEHFAAVEEFSAVPGIAIDPQSGKVFWSDNSLDSIFSKNLDGTGQTTEFSGVNAFSIVHVQAIPEPSGLLLYSAGIFILSFRRRKRLRT